MYQRRISPPSRSLTGGRSRQGFSEARRRCGQDPSRQGASASAEWDAGSKSRITREDRPGFPPLEFLPIYVVCIVGQYPRWKTTGGGGIGPVSTTVHYAYHDTTVIYIPVIPKAPKTVQEIPVETPVRTSQHTFSTPPKPALPPRCPPGSEHPEETQRRF